jgi:subtilisin family serine protease
VASHDEGGAVSWYSTRGAYVDVAAPGSGIMSTYKDGRWTYMSGTSMATPHVAGAAALLVAADPDRTPAELRALLQESATDAGPIGHDTDYGWGRIDLVGALHG